jgi:NDP-sugar pyrophosphorylase family protein
MSYTILSQLMGRTKPTVAIGVEPPQPWPRPENKETETSLLVATASKKIQSLQPLIKPYPEADALLEQIRKRKNIELHGNKSNVVAMIPAAGRGSRMFSLTDENPKAMLPLHNKPLIAWHLDKFINEGINDVVIIVGYKKEKLIDYVNSFYAEKLNIIFVEQKQLDGLADAVLQGIVEMEKHFDIESKSLLVVLADTIVKDRIDTRYDMVGYHTVDDYARWCLLNTDEHGIITEFIDKPQRDPGTRKAVIGVYHFRNIVEMKKAIEEIERNNIRIKNEFQLSSAMEIYKDNFITGNLYGIEFKEWFDCGDIATFNATKKNITRHFNSITITEDNTCVKRSDNCSKINDEIMWYLNLPNKLRVFTPQLIDYNNSPSGAFYELEYVNFSPLNELFLYMTPTINEWKRVLDSTFNMLERFRMYSNKSNYNFARHIEDTLIVKTKSRLNTLSTDSSWASLMSASTIMINGERYKNLPLLFEEMYKYCVDNIMQNSRQYWQIIHGDLFFGNMLYDVSSNTLKVIDPRGSFGTPGIYGDMRYDLAKLNHSIVGKYDFIVNDLYALIKDDDEFQYIIYDSQLKHGPLIEMFKQMVIDHGYNYDDITVITGMLFLSMIPLHSENLNHQKMFYLIGIQLLNEVL